MIRQNTPFRNLDELIGDITGFLVRHRALFAEHGTRISDYFEMSCYNGVVLYYSERGFAAAPKQLGPDSVFNYKLAPTGLPVNFSYFEVRREYSGKEYVFEIHHNLRCESAHERSIYLTPDISVIQQGSVQNLDGRNAIYMVSRRFAYVPANCLQTFVEAKNLNPFPELLFSFNGFVLELMPEALKKQNPVGKPNHIAPTLALSGKGNLHTKRIIDSLTNRYSINIIERLFYVTSGLYSRRYSKQKVSSKGT